MNHNERLIDEMAVILCGLSRLDDEAACIVALVASGFRAAVIMKYFDEALDLARMTRADGWHPSPVGDDSRVNGHDLAITAQR